ncbi:hypothetical protein AKO1_003701 [Acrasis kona]|uniref:Uncharacterized protein n=1 Tax=Acrasis kona TaxID=1008807 RepID=A0AAW2Z5Q5_9EUKA
MDEFRRRQKIEKMKLEDDRILKLREARYKVANKRNMLRNMTTMQREKIHQAMEKMRITKKLDIPELQELLGADFAMVAESVRVRNAAMAEQIPSLFESKQHLLPPSPNRRAHSASRAINKKSHSTHHHSQPVNEPINNEPSPNNDPVATHSHSPQRSFGRRPRSSGRSSTFSNYHSAQISSTRKSAADALASMYQVYSGGLLPPTHPNARHSLMVNGGMKSARQKHGNTLTSSPSHAKVEDKMHAVNKKNYIKPKTSSNARRPEAGLKEGEETAPSGDDKNVQEQYCSDEDDNIYQYRQGQNEELLQMMSEERQRDLKRSEILSRARTEQQRQYLMQRFQHERVEANSKIIQFAENQDKVLSNRLIERSSCN